MAEMIVNVPNEKHVVDDYDFTFIGGMTMPVTVNTEVGDSILFSDTVVRISLTSKPSINDPKKQLPAENITIYTAHLAAYQHRVREVIELTPEQQHEWAKTMKQLGHIQ